MRRFKELFHRLWRFLERVHLASWLLEFVSWPKAMISGLSVLVVAVGAWLASMSRPQLFIVALATFAGILAIVNLLVSLRGRLRVDVPREVPPAPVMPPPVSEDYDVEEYEDETAAVTGKVTFGWGTVAVRLPTFEGVPKIEFVRQQASRKPSLRDVSDVSFSALVESSEALGEWTWIARGRLLKRKRAP